MGHADSSGFPLGQKRRLIDLKRVITADEFNVSNCERADVILCAALYSDIHASFKEFVRVYVLDIEAQIRGKIVLITPASELAQPSR